MEKIEQLKKKIEKLNKTIKEYELTKKINNLVSKILSSSGNIDEVASIIKKFLNLHTCYISYDIDTKSDKARVAGLSSSFGSWFTELTKKNDGIPFSFAKQDKKKYIFNLTASEFIRQLDGPTTLSPDYFRPLALIDSINEVGIDKKTMYDFLTTKLGYMKIIPMRNNQGVIILIKNTDEIFSKYEEEFLEMLAYGITISINDVYHIYHDELGIKNELYLKSNLENIVNKSFTLVYIKIEGLKQINDDYSREVGNMLLVEIEKEIFLFLLKHRFKSPEKNITREKGSLFKVVLMDVPSRIKLKTIIGSLYEELTKPYVFIEKENLVINISIKISAYLKQNNDDNIEEILNKANYALEFAKKSENDNIVIYNFQLHKRRKKHKYINRVLKNYLKNNKTHEDKEELFLLYQEKINTENNKIIGVEALLRMRTNEYGILSPDEFIKNAEEENLIINLDLWVIRDVCKLIKKLVDDHIYLPISLNISRQHINSINFYNELKNIFDELDFYKYKDYFKFEITETGLLNETGLKVLKEINKNLGLKISIDDVGKDNSNIHTVLILYLNNLIENVKIDKKFIDTIILHDDENVIYNENNEIVFDNDGCKFILSLLRILNGLFSDNNIAKPDIICEGVEFEKQIKWLQENGCHNFQGYYFGKPKTIEEIIDKYNLKFSCINN